MYALRLAFGAILLGMIIASGSLAFESDLVRGVIGGDTATAVTDTVEGEERMERQIVKGDCWTAAGEATGYPTRMWFKTAYGAYVSEGRQWFVDRAVKGVSPLTVVAFCDGVDLTGL
jgi:hypothetical protein